MTDILDNGKLRHGIDRGVGRPVLLVHGFPLDHSLWKYQLDSLSPEYRVICPDLPGFGLNPPMLDCADGSPLTMKALADWLQQLIASLELDEPVVFCGLSMGGYIGWQFAQQYPQHLAGLVACHTRAAADIDVVSRGRRTAARDVLRQGTQGMAQTMLEKLWPPDLPGDRSPSASGDRAALHAVIAGTRPESYAAGQLGMALRPDSREWLSKISVPSLFVAGSEDAITPPEEMQADADRVPGAQFACLQAACHVSPLQAPQRFHELLQRFLATVWD